MKRALGIGFGCSLLLGLATAYLPAAALAAAPGPSGTGLCVPLESTCAAVDSNFTPSSVRISSSGNVTTLACVGSTTAAPAKGVKCNGELLGGTSGETAPLQACSITLGGKTVATDDWAETISSKGRVALVCRFGGADTK